MNEQHYLLPFTSDYMEGTHPAILKKMMEIQSYADAWLWRGYYLAPRSRKNSRGLPRA